VHVHPATATKWLLILLGLGLGLMGTGACGAGASGSSPVTAPPTTAIAGMDTTPATAAPAPSATAPVDPPAVTIRNFAFSPANTTVKVGMTVVWTNADRVDHTVTANAGRFGSPAISANGTFAFTFITPGAYPYHCSIHPSMRGFVVVTP
jgi:plastocyanin